MKRLFTLLIGMSFVLAAFSQAPLRVLYLTDPVPFSTEANKHDQEMFDALTNLGFMVTAEAISETSATTGYDVVFTSEAIGSGHASWPRYNEAPMPMVMGKVWAIKGPALGWVTGENSGTDYGNSGDSIFVKVADHPINCNLDDEFQITEPGSTEEAIGAFVNFPGGAAGATTVYTSKSNADEHTVVAIEPFTQLNGKTLQNRVAIYGVHQVVYDEINDNAKQLLKNCVLWAANGTVDCGSTALYDQNTGISANVYPNPSNNGIFNIRLDQNVASAQINILGVDGRTIRTETINNVDLISLDLSDLSTGIYILDINGVDINYSQIISLQY